MRSAEDSRRLMEAVILQNLPEHETLIRELLSTRNPHMTKRVRNKLVSALANMELSRDSLG